MIAFLVCVQIFFLITGTLLMQRLPREGLSWLECQMIVNRVKRLEKKRRKHVRL